MRLTVLSSFPRSGNTWMRFVLATAMAGARPSSADLDRLLPDAHKPLASPDAWLADPAVILKSHFEPGALSGFLQKLEGTLAPARRIEEIRVLHVVRNPFDVAISLAKYYEIPDDRFDAFIDAVLDPKMMVPDVYAKWGFGNWLQNNARWLKAAQAPTPPIDILRYEDLVADPEAGFEALFTHLGMMPKTSVADCVAQCAPAALRQLEDDELARGAPGLFAGFHSAKKAGARFVNAAKAGGFRDRLSAAQIEKGLAGLGPAMTALGYDVGQYQPLKQSA